MKKGSLIVSFIILMGITLNAQNEIDALRYSYLTLGGTARFMGLGGAFTAVGAEISTLSTNPAGIGLFKSSEFVFTPAIFNSKTTGTYYGGVNSDYKSNFNIGSVGFIYSIDVSKQGQSASNSSTTKEWKNIQIGFGLVRNNNFHNRILLSGTNPENSLLDAYVEFANGNAPEDLNQFDTKLAYETYLIDPIPGTLDYTNRAPLYPDGSIAPVDQKESVLTEGYMNEMTFSFGANYGDKLYLGASLGIPYLRFYEESNYQEFNNVSSDTNTFNSFRKRDWLDTRGSGVNFKVGVIFRATDWIRFGAAFHTPTYFNSMRDEWRSTMYSDLNNGERYDWSSPLGNFDYKLETPMRIVGGVAFIFNQYGLVSAEYEYVDYSKARLRSHSYDFFNENQAINNKYTVASNIKAGTEWRYGKFNFRGGYTLYGNPYNTGINENIRNIYSGGIGYREKYFYIDFTYSHSSSSQDYYPYESANVFVQAAEIANSTNTYLLTIGIKY